MSSTTCITASVVAAHTGAPELKWELAKSNAPEGTAPGSRSEWFGPVAVFLEDQGRMIWRRSLSPRMKNAFRIRGEDVGRVVWPPLPPVVIAREVVIVLDGSGVLVLRRSDGGVLLDKSADAESDAATYFDNAWWTLKVGAETCSGRASHGRLVAKCGRNIVFFGAGHVVFMQVDPFESIIVRQVDVAEIAQVGSPGFKTTLQERGATLTVQAVTYVQ